MQGKGGGQLVVGLPAWSGGCRQEPGAPPTPRLTILCSLVHPQTHAQIPYSDMTPLQAAVGVVQKGLRPLLPPNCPPQLAALMTACWDASPLHRPSFKELTPQLQLLLDVVREEEARKAAAAAAAASSKGGGLLSKLNLRGASSSRGDGGGGGAGASTGIRQL